MQFSVYRHCKWSFHNYRSNLSPDRYRSLNIWITVHITSHHINNLKRSFYKKGCEKHIHQQHHATSHYYIEIHHATSYFSTSHRITSHHITGTLLYCITLLICPAPYRISKHITSQRILGLRFFPSFLLFAWWLPLLFLVRIRTLHCSVPLHIRWNVTVFVRVLAISSRSVNLTLPFIFKLKR
jgi:hypothetical protein